MPPSRLEGTRLEETRAVWSDWVVRHLNPGPPLVAVAVEAALQALELGGSSSAAGFAARQRLGLLSGADLLAVQEEMRRVQAARQELGAPAAWELAEPARSQVRELLEARAGVLEAILEGRFASGGASSTQAATPATADAPAPAAARPSAPSLREFLGERSILLFSYTGAFLLIVATVLFEVYGQQGQGGLRLAGVLGLDLVFAGAGAACWRVPQLRVVGHTYVALAALMLPLVFAAAYVFLDLQGRGLSLDAALALAGLGCCIVYGLLAVSLRSPGYGVLALLALPAGWYGLLQALGLHSWLGPGLAPLTGAYAWLAFGSNRVARLGRLFEVAAEILLHATALVASLVAGVMAVFQFSDLGRAAYLRPALALGLIAAAYLGAGALVGVLRLAVPALVAAALAWLNLMLALAPAGWLAPAVAAPTIGYALLAGLPQAGTRLRAFRFGAEVALPFLALLALGLALRERLAETLAVVTAAYGIYCWLSRRVWMTWTVGVGVSATVLATNDRLQWGPRGDLVELVLLAVLFAAAARPLRSRVRHFFRAAAALQAGACVLLTSPPDSWQALALLAGAALMLLIALDVASPWWLLGTSALVAAAWLPLAKTLLPPPPHPDLGTLIATYSPLPVGLAVAALITGRLASARWALPLYLAAAAFAVLVVAAGVGWQDYLLLGGLLLAYAGVTYVAAVVERAGPAVPVALAAGLGGTLALLHARSAPDYAYPLAMALAAWAAYLGRLVWGWIGARGRGWVELHRYSGLTGAALTALFGLADRALWTATGALALAALGVTLALALMLLLDGRLERVPLLDYAAGAAAALGGIWIARFLELTNAQAYAALPGVALVAIGVGLPYDTRIRSRKPLAWGAAGLGMAVLLGTTALQAFTQTGWGWLYTPLLVLEGVAALMLGIGFRNRVVALGGSAGVAVGALWSLFVFEVPLWADFGLIALVLLAAGALLAVLRNRLGAARAELAQTWRDWS